MVPFYIYALTDLVISQRSVGLELMSYQKASIDVSAVVSRIVFRLFANYPNLYNYPIQTCQKLYIHTYILKSGDTVVHGGDKISFIIGQFG